MAVAIDQILRLAPSISGPIEPVVSSTKATSTTGLAACPDAGSSVEQRLTRGENGSEASGHQRPRNVANMVTLLKHRPTRI